MQFRIRITAMKLISISRKLSEEVGKLKFSPPVVHCYNPLDYAKEPGEVYLKRFGSGSKEVVLVGMNPGPFGMAQTGVPFGDVGMVRDWMGIKEKVGKPADEHPKRIVEGFDCPRGEVSGRRLWGWAKDRFVEPESFFDKFFVWNYCPLCFMEEGGKNRTPDKLPTEERDALFALCDQALREIVEALSPKFVIGVGKFAQARIESAIDTEGLVVGSILHPSPASPIANRGWAPQAEKGFEKLGVSLGG
ncbi:single-stranded DNA-binding protein [bacterium J17]|nr:single-stranded DNA-binding protein [bacterium J17]